jgi:hypothetical protein
MAEPLRGLAFEWLVAVVVEEVVVALALTARLEVGAVLDLDYSLMGSAMDSFGMNAMVECLTMD